MPAAETNPALEAARRSAVERWLQDPVTIDVIKAFAEHRNALRRQLEANVGAASLDDRQIRTLVMQISAHSTLLETLTGHE